MAKKRSKQGIWSASSRASHPMADAAVKSAAKVKARKFVEEVLKPLFIKPPPEGHAFNYIKDVTLNWTFVFKTDGWPQLSKRSKAFLPEEKSPSKTSMRF
jgi:hypothetical protein